MAFADAVEEVYTYNSERRRKAASSSSTLKLPPCVTDAAKTYISAHALKNPVSKQ